MEGLAKGGGDWLALLAAGLERVGVPVIACRATTGEARFVLDPTGAFKGISLPVDRWPADLLQVTIGRREGPCFRRLGDLSLGYTSSSGQLDDNSKRALEVLARLVERLQASKVARDLETLESPTIRGFGVLEPHRALTFAFPFCTAERVVDDGVRVDEVLVRVTGRCNQSCPFCSAPPPHEEPPLSALTRLFHTLDDAAPRSTVTLTGGEPTLRSDLPEIVTLALGDDDRDREVELQTNGVFFAKSDRLENYEPFLHSDRLRFFVSLHAMDSESYDLCTGTRGMWPRAISGLENLLTAGFSVILSLVANRWNAAEENSLRDYVDAVAARFAGHIGPKLALHFSITLCPEHRPGVERCLIRYSELGPRLEAAYERARERGLRPEPLLSSTYAAIPACFLSDGYRDGVAQKAYIEQGEGSEELERLWVKPERCRSCSRYPRCRGLPRAYVQRFGRDEVDPLRAKTS